jgi:hypothetical protein
MPISNTRTNELPCKKNTSTIRFMYRYLRMVSDFETYCDSNTAGKGRMIEGFVIGN